VDGSPFRVTRTERMVFVTRLEIMADYFQIYVCDPAYNEDWSALWTDQSVDNRIVALPHTLVFGTGRNMPVPVDVVVHQQLPCSNGGNHHSTDLPEYRYRRWRIINIMVVRWSRASRRWTTAWLLAVYRTRPARTRPSGVQARSSDRPASK